MKNLLFIILLSGVITACNDLSPKEKELQKIINKPMNLKMFKTVQQANRILPFEELKQTHRYLSVVYLQNSCTPDVNHREWLTDVFTKIPLYNSNYDLDLADLLPHIWKKSNDCQNFPESSN